MFRARNSLLLSVFVALSTTSIARAESFSSDSETLLSSASPVREHCVCNCVHPTLGLLKAEPGPTLDLTFEYTDIQSDAECNVKNNKRCFGYENKVENHPPLLSGTLKSCEITVVYDPGANSELGGGSTSPESSDATFSPELELAETSLAHSSGTEAEELVEAVTEVYAESFSSITAPVKELCTCYCVNPTLGALVATRSVATNYEYTFLSIGTERECVAKNNRRCLGIDVVDGLPHFGFLTGCQMSAVPKY